MSASSQAQGSKNLAEEINNIPLADEDAEEEPDSNSANNDDETSKYGLISDSGFPHDQSFESLASNEQVSILGRYHPGNFENLIILS